MDDRPFDGLEGSSLAMAARSAGGFQRSVLSTERGWALIFTSRLDPLACAARGDLISSPKNKQSGSKYAEVQLCTNVGLLDWTTEVWALCTLRLQPY